MQLKRAGEGRLPVQGKQVYGASAPISTVSIFRSPKATGPKCVAVPAKQDGVAVLNRQPILVARETQAREARARHPDDRPKKKARAPPSTTTSAPARAATYHWRTMKKRLCFASTA